MSDTKFTVLIPTRDRSDTLGSTIASCLAQDHPGLEVIVSDNLSTDGTAELVASFTDPRLKYVRPSHRLSMSGNFEFLLSHVTSGYALHLGSDDMLLPDALARVGRIIAETGTKAVTSRMAIYNWPSSPDPRVCNRLVFSTRGGSEIRSADQMVREVVSFRREFCELPGTYSSFVDHSVLKSAYADGRYYHSITPDAYSAIVNCAYLDDYVYSNAPFLLSGLSARSNGVAHFFDTKSKEADRYKTENDIGFHADVPYCLHAMEFITAEAFLQARDHAPPLAQYSLDIERMCHLALRNCLDRHYGAVREAVNETRRRYGLPGEAPAVRSGALKREARLARLTQRVRLLRQGVRALDASDFDVDDGLGAARLAHVLAKFDQHGYNNKLRTMLRWL